MGYVSVKVVLISTGILSVAMGLKLTIPLLSHFLLNDAPHVWTFLLTCFTPPYLYILLNFIILTIVASSKFQHSPPDAAAFSAAYDVPPAAVHVPAPEPVKISASVPTDYNAAATAAVSGDYSYTTKPVLSDDSSENSVGYNTPVKSTAANDGAAFSPSLQKKDSVDFAFANENEKPPVSARFGHRKAVRASPEGGKVVALGVAKAKKQETLESTWKTITEGRAMPLTRHLKKSETWETQRNASPLKDLNGGRPAMKKSETFGGRDRNASPKLRKEPSLSQDELNRRVEAFINKFNAEMRLQRQESLKQYREMMNRGTL